MEAFSRIAPAIPVVADVVVSDKIFDVLASSTSNRLHFCVYDKYLIRLERYFLPLALFILLSILDGKNFCKAQFYLIFFRSIYYLMYVYVLLVGLLVTRPSNYCPITEYKNVQICRTSLNS